MYERGGLNMVFEMSQFEGERGNGVEAGVMEMLDRMQTNRLKVFGHLNDWFDEFELFHRKDGKIVKERDDLMAATRYAIMMLRHAKAGPERNVLDPYRRRGRAGATNWMAA
jgi:Terminase RNaseH-like domain